MFVKRSPLNTIGSVQRIEVSRHYGIPVARGYAFVTDVRNWSHFFPGFIALDPESRWTAAGDVASLTTKLLGRTRRVTLTLERIEPKQAVRRLLQQTLDALEVAFASGERTTERSGAG